MDCLFCEIFTSYRQPCDDFYMGYGPPLKGMRSAAEIREFDGVLLRALVTIDFMARDGVKMSWTDFCFMMRKVTKGS